MIATGNPSQKFESLGRNIGLLDRQTSDIAARSRQTRNKAGSDRVPRYENNGDDRCRLPYRGHSATDGDNDVDLQPDKLGRDFGITLGAALRPAILDRDVTVLDPAQFAQVRNKSGRPRTEG